MSTDGSRPDGGVAAVLEFMTLLGKGDFEGGTDLLHPEVVVREPRTLPFGGDYHGVAGFRELSGHLAKVSPKSEGFEYFDAGDRVVVRMTARYTSARSGESATTEIMELYTVRDGRIAEVDVYLKDPSSVAALDMT